MNILINAIGVITALSVAGTSTWVLIDANRLGMKGGERHMLSNSPVKWFIACLGIWIIAFPLYLVARSRAVRERAASAPVESFVTAASFHPPRLQAGEHGAPPWVGTASLALGVASIPFSIFGILAAPLWLAGFGLGIWGAVAAGPGRKQAIAGIIVSVVGFITMILAIVAMAIWLASR